MTKQELLKHLIDCKTHGDTEAAHSLADNLLLKYIHDSDIEDAYNDIDKWYA